MSKGAHNVFTEVINFLGANWRPKHVTIKLFEITEITRYVLVHNLIDLLKKYGLKEKNIICM
jgi:hypothetical protein